MNHRVLIVSPNFPPINAADHQRIRMSLPYFAEFGWESIVLCVDPDFIEGVVDPYLSLTIPSNIEIIKSYAISPKFSRKLGMGDLAFRSTPFLIQKISKYLEKNSIDLVYFSTTVFITMVLGRYWLERYKIPYILDFQDPWLNDYYDRTNITPPGGKLKYKTAQTLARILEPFVLKKSSHIITVSPEYPKTLKQRYSWLHEEKFTVLPFGAPEKDFEILPSLNIQQTIFDPNDGYKHWVYVGRGGDDMSFSLKSLFSAIQTHRQLLPEAWQKIKLHFVGTKYSIFDRNKEIEAIAKSYNLDEIVTEHPQRIPYFEALQVLTDSHAILLIGSDDKSYSASKIYPCILARKPILAILHQQSLVVKVIESCQAGQIVTFNDHATTNILEQLIAKLDWLLSQSQDYTPTTDWQAFNPYTAREMTRQQCAIFDRYISS
ncbi:MAG: hypothetical protein DCF19_15900 [Pseudanabaena frigida]|uniref:Glycosyltransferase subfamily 4-like N-terminal domain-containing protein n=1 Tax=Pseudanabaena frigida TaxID=945775 RepID=A0A2W4W0H0_9CYAN|nr:MAG: hypothetical protein DCF19_15900 [Pseudanabaena frigida]